MSAINLKRCKASLEKIEQNQRYIFTFGGYYDKFYGIENQNQLQEIINYSKRHGNKTCICENTKKCGRLNLYFDLDSKEYRMSEQTVKDVIKDLKEVINQNFPNTTNEIFVKDASDEQITSLHLVVRLKTITGQAIYIKDKDEMKELFKHLQLESPFDINAYSGYNVRILHSNKYDMKGKRWTDRMFKTYEDSEIKEEIYSLCTYCPEEEYMMLDEYVKKQFMIDFVKEQGYTKKYTLEQVNRREQDQHLSLILKEQKCVKRKHKSNNSTAMLYEDNITIKCMDQECNSTVHQRIKVEKFLIKKIDYQESTEEVEEETEVDQQDLENYTDLQCDSEEEKKYFLRIVNKDYQYIPKLYDLNKPNRFLYVYEDGRNNDEDGSIMYFDCTDQITRQETNGGIWRRQGGIKIARKEIRDYIVEYFNKKIQQLDTKAKRRKYLEKRLDIIRDKIDRRYLLDQYLMETYNKRINFNNNPEYVHFKNGTFDLKNRKFVKTIPEMYNTFQIEYNYDAGVSYKQIYEQLVEIMQPDEFDWLLKQISNCLNPKKVIKEKQIIILNGYGNNGKTLLFNLISNTFDLNAYSVTSRSAMIQAKNDSSSSATPDTAKLINKRFCQISELDKKQGFNQQQIKVLTGGEQIQTRALYQNFSTFRPSAGIFVNCNEVPYIDTQDGGFLNRMKIIDLKYQFVENPEHEYQKRINRELHEQVETEEWKQGMMNMLIEYYYKQNMGLPKSIQGSINLRIELQKSTLDLWAERHIKRQTGSYVFAEQARQHFIEETQQNLGRIQFNRQLNHYLKSKINVFIDMKFGKKNDRENNTSGQAFINCVLE